MKKECEVIISHFGVENQILKIIEELLELTLAVVNNDRVNIIEEIADVEIMLNQLKLIYSIDEEEIEIIKAFKIKRTLNLIGA